MIVENPPGFIVRTEAQKAASANGFRLPRAIEHGWLGFASTTAQVMVWVARESTGGQWLLSIDRPEVIAELGISPAPDTVGPGGVGFAFGSLSDLYAALDRVYRLGVSLPDAPLHAFQAAAQDLPRATEAERLVIQRVGQDLFRKALLAYWGGRCPLTGITDEALLRASTSFPGSSARPTSSGWTCTTGCCCRHFGMRPSMPGWSASPTMVPCSSPAACRRHQVWHSGWTGQRSWPG